STHKLTPFFGQIRPGPATCAPEMPARLVGERPELGNSTVKLASRPGPSLCARMFPPWASTSARVMVRPIPLPPLGRSVLVDEGHGPFAVEDRRLTGFVIEDRDRPDG